MTGPFDPTKVRVRTQGRSVGFSSITPYSTTAEYLAFFRNGISEMVRVLAPGGEFRVRPPGDATRRIRALLEAHGLEFVEWQPATWEAPNRPWMLFRKKAVPDAGDA